MRVLVNMECSGVVRRALRALGHDAWSCDLKPSEDGGEHIQGDGYAVAYWGCWDGMVAHPDCTFMANSSSKHLYVGMRKENGPDPARWDAMRASALGFRRLLDAPIQHIAVENPVMLGYAQEIIGAGPTQTIQPWMFGHMQCKRTCLWLKNLPPLVETENVYAAMMQLDYDERCKVHWEPPGPQRKANRSRTFEGIGHAMAAQWFGDAAERQEAA